MSSWNSSNTGFGGFGQSNTTSGFGKPSTFGQTSFGQQNQSNASPFGQQSQSNTSPFGQQNQQNQSSPFGQSTSQSTGAFGQLNQSNGFGQPSSFGQTNQQSSSFGQANQQSTWSPFGQRNTGFGSNTQNTGFGQTNQNTGFGHSNASPFGQTNQSNASVFGQSTTQSGIFGQNQQNQQQNQQNQQKPFSFGANTSTTPGTGFSGSSSTQNTSGGLFGSNITQNKPTFGFGSSTSNATTTQPQSTSLFGGSSTANAPGQSSGFSFGKPATGTGLFGGPSGTQQAGAGTVTGLFGSSSNATGTTGGPGSTGGLFGSGGSSLFHKPNASTFGTTVGFGSTGLAGATPFGQQSQPQVQLPAFNITPLSRPSDLPEPMQKELEQLDEYITSQSRVAEELKNQRETHDDTIASVPRDVELLIRKFSIVAEALKYDDRILAELKKLSDGASQDADIGFQLLSHLRSPTNASFGASISGATTKVSRRGDQLSPYFNRKIEEFTQRLKELASTVTEVERGMDSVERDSIDGSGDLTTALGTLQEEYRLFMSLGNKVAELHHTVGRLDPKAFAA